MNDSQARKPRSSKLGLTVLIVGILGTAANYAAAKAFPNQWGGPNIGGGMLQLLFYAGIVAGAAVIVSGLIKARR